MPSAYLHYKIITSLYYEPFDSWQCDDFSSMIKNKIDGYVSVNLDSGGYLYEWNLKDALSEKCCIPKDTIIDIYFYSNNYVDKRKNYTPAFSSGKIYSYKDDERKYYVYVKLSKDSVFNNYNEAELKNESKKKYMENRISDLNSTIDRLNDRNYEKQESIMKIKI